MKRLLAWLLLIFSLVAFYFMSWLGAKLAYWIVTFYDKFHWILKILLFIVVGGISLICILAPVIYGILLVISLCERLSPSKSGLRYIIAAVFVFLFCVLAFVYQGYTSQGLIIIIYGFALLFFSRTARKDNAKKNLILRLLIPTDQEREQFGLPASPDSLDVHVDKDTYYLSSGKERSVGLKPGLHRLFYGYGDYRYQILEFEIKSKDDVVVIDCLKIDDWHAAAIIVDPASQTAEETPAES